MLIQFHFTVDSWIFQYRNRLLHRMTIARILLKSQSVRCIFLFPRDDYVSFRNHSLTSRSSECDCVAWFCREAAAFFFSEWFFDFVFFVVSPGKIVDHRSFLNVPLMCNTYNLWWCLTFYQNSFELVMMKLDVAAVGRVRIIQRFLSQWEWIYRLLTVHLMFLCSIFPFRQWSGTGHSVTFLVTVCHWLRHWIALAACYVFFRVSFIGNLWVM